jgi:DNA-binding CsgD family transcriptional regulator
MGHGGTSANLLLEREAELGRIAAAVDDARAGHGATLLIEGRAGSGKTSLLVEATARAHETGLTVLTARGSELERDFGFGVARQLFEPPLRAASPAHRERLLRGAAALAVPALGLSEDSVGEESFPALHGLYWLLAELSDAGPLLVTVVDAHWTDRASLRWLAYVANRIEGMAVMLAVAARPGAERPNGAGSGLLAEPSVELLRPEPLGIDAVAALVRARLGAEPDGEFASACHWVTAGNPLAVVELLRELEAEGAQPRADVAPTLVQRTPARLARHILARLDRAGAPARRLAGALAVLGDGTALRTAAALAELDPAAAAEAVDALADADILAREQPRRFLHPLIRAAVHDDLPPGARGRAHARAAELLTAERADAEVIAAHLLVCEPAGDPTVVAGLRRAAARASAAGAPDAALRHLRRALAEPPPADEQVAVLHELGRAEAATSDPAAPEHLRAALEHAQRPVERAAIAGELCQVMAFLRDWDGAVALARETLAELGDRDRSLALRLEALAAALTWQDARWAAEFERDLPRLRRLVEDPGGSAARPLMLVLGVALAARGERRAEALTLTERGLDGGAFLAEEAADHIAASQAANAYLFAEESDRALALTEAMMADARSRGAVLNLVTGAVHHGLARQRRGELAEAEADARLADELARTHGYLLAEPFCLGYLAEVLVERGGAAEVLPRLEAMSLDELPTSSMVCVLHGRALARLCVGDRAAAIADLRATGARLEAMALLAPTVLGWRVQLAMALAEQAPEEARALAVEDARRARRGGLRCAEGVALRALARTERGTGRVETLREAVALLEPTDGRLELAKALTDLGAALRACGRRAEAREPLRRALDLAHRSGARPLAERARAEALAAGARPRRELLTGVEALTPSELRVARLAADGRSNREIAQALFVTKKTIGDHLGAAYRKLGIGGREDLAGALADHPPGR